MAQYLCIWVRAYWFSVTSFSKWLPGGHIRFFGFWMAWFWQLNSSLLWNFGFKFHVRVLCGCRQKPNCRVILNNIQSTHSHPLLWGGGILVDHWSTISSFHGPNFTSTVVSKATLINKITFETFCFNLPWSEVNLTAFCNHNMFNGVLMPRQISIYKAGFGTVLPQHMHNLIC